MKIIFGHLTICKILSLYSGSGQVLSVNKHDCKDGGCGTRRSEMFQKVDYGLPAKICRLVGCTKMVY